MKPFFAAWREFQDTVVRHPFCRYTILPTGIILAIWLAVLPLTAWVCWRDGLELRDFVDVLETPSASDLFFLWSPVSAGLMGIILTGRWLPVFIGLLTMIFPMAAYGLSNVLYEYNREYFGFAVFWLAILSPVVIGLLILDKQAARRPVLPRRMKWLAGAAAVFCAIQVPASVLAENCWVQCGLLETLMAGILFTVFLDITWRIGTEDN